MKESIKSIIKNFFIILIIIGILYVIDNYKDFIKEPEINYDSNILDIYYLDVGEGDSILIKYQDKNILIDAGNNEDGKLLVNYFKELNIKEFEYLITTHSHEDHIGGMDDIIKNFKINNFLIPNVETEYITYKEVIDILNKKNILIKTPILDEEIKVKELLFKFLYIGNNPEDINENSMIIKLIYNNNSFMFTGDAPKETEKLILDKDLKSNVLKVGHHGSKYSSSKEFIEKVYPEIAIISVEKDNDYHFPHQTTLNKLNSINSKIYRTDIDHTIHLISDGNNIKIETIETNTNYLEK